MRVLTTVLFVPRYSFFFFSSQLEETELHQSFKSPDKHLIIMLHLASEIDSDPTHKSKQAKCDRTSPCIVTYPWHDHCRDKLDIIHAGLVSLQLCLKSHHQHHTARQVRVKILNIEEAIFVPFLITKSYLNPMPITETIVKTIVASHCTKSSHPLIKLRSQMKI
jgi:hypothetical protein